ncbi:helix-turn-helix domain-containing protein [Arcticibacter tournemirensis]|uniref:AraC family transcriptional regulator n=1 Tax=Arcticibacter tournemirensis TaxID=699437 RepID=A0A4Q0M432_9SPHI|nr:helix-turn-helix transcriptional regulator [Arcticibacter tournemirensis]RXF67573.1 AraC family transcriptional regulator [Arcticibacter tournemirensis]
MENSTIPRLELETFAREGYKVPLLNIEYHPLNSRYFIIENRNNYPIRDYISPQRRKFYKIFHMTSGTGILIVGLHRYEMGPNEIAFIHPDEIMSWQTTSGETGGHFCLVHPEYFGPDADHVRNLFRQYPYFAPDRAVIRLTDEQSATINGYFEAMLSEDRGANDDKKQAILLQLQMLLLESQRAGRNLAKTTISEEYGYIYRFLSLLESAFQVQKRDTYAKLKTAAEFANELHVHPNYLNALVRTQTGKTLREHIQDRLLYEAKSLLVQTDWGINEISDGLGFSGQAAFTSFFRKKTNTSPSAYRKNAMIPVNI